MLYEASDVTFKFPLNIGKFSKISLSKAELLLAEGETILSKIIGIPSIPTSEEDLPSTSKNLEDLNENFKELMAYIRDVFMGKKIQSMPFAIKKISEAIKEINRNIDIEKDKNPKDLQIIELFFLNEIISQVEGTQTASSQIKPFLEQLGTINWTIETSDLDEAIKNIKFK